MVSTTAWRVMLSLLALAMVTPIASAKLEPDALPEHAPDGVTQPGDSELVAIVLDVAGRAQVRIDPPVTEDEAPAAPAPWRTITQGDQVPLGATIRTGAHASVTLRVGLNATVRINSFSRVRIGELAQDQDAANTTLRTTIVLERGDLDVRVDHIGDAANDFAIVTQQATLAVRGTNFSVGVDGLDGLRVQGAQTNSFRAIEIQYLEEEQATALSQGRIDSDWRNPALTALASTLETPNQGISQQEYVARLGTPVAQLVSGRHLTGDQIAGVREIEVRNITAEQVIDSIGDGKDGPPPQGESVGGGR